uniref:Uncharacterized protein n=1 Tax=Araneus ventricosus TaxID=182803 RepID=A0A4Y2LER5_ARAVE|nr:hypothetical protein AVEN_189989-1 [Araneus ventricosus]GBN12640.1 hypothetical protein AVEN_242359-1 [Araneus ventricosus]GBN12660.1 hypothetical protein AVEN_18541-1 [Araneus ventricosus]
MMDLLVQAASATKISPAGHTIHVFGDGGKGTSTLHYKPSTPIGSLDANTICIVPKKDAHDGNGRRLSKATHRPFELQWKLTSIFSAHFSSASPPSSKPTDRGPGVSQSQDIRAKKHGVPGERAGPQQIPAGQAKRSGTTPHWGHDLGGVRVHGDHTSL